MFLSKSSSVKACIPLEIFSLKTILFFSFDLKSGYHHVDIFPDHRKFLAFSWHFGTNCVRYFQFTVLPFGLSSAPFIFTKLIKPLEAFWRLQGIPIAIFFFDDGVGAGSSRDIAESNGSVVLSSLAQCGFLVNQEKSDWNPKNFFLGLASLLKLARAEFVRLMRESKAFVAILASSVLTLRCLLPSVLKGLRPLLARLFLYLLVAVMSLKL